MIRCSDTGAGSRHSGRKPDVSQGRTLGPKAGQCHTGRRIFLGGTHLTLTSRVVRFGDRDLVLSGFPEDAYFNTVDPNDHTHQLFVHALRSLRPGAITCDVGANIGVTAAMAAQHASRVYCFEPSPRTFQALKQTIQNNNLQDRIEIANLALGDREGTLPFFDDPSSGSASHMITDATLGRVSTVQVRVTTLDNFVIERSIDRLDLIKIDIEGFEIDALRGALETIRSFRTSALIEFNAFTMIGFRNINPREMLDFIRLTFPYVYRWTGKPQQIINDNEALGFIHDNLVSVGCVDDLYGTFDPVL